MKVDAAWTEVEERLGSMAFYPVNLDITGRQCLVVGGGKIAQRKVETLLLSGAAVRVVSPDLTEKLNMLSENGLISCKKRQFEKTDVLGCFLVICATNHRKVNGYAAMVAKDAGALVNVVDACFSSDFQVPAQVRRGNLLFTVSTGGKSPEMAKQLCRELRHSYGEEYGEFLNTVSVLRNELKELVEDPAERETFWRRMLSEDVFHLLGKGELDIVEARIKNAIGSFRAEP